MTIRIFIDWINYFAKYKPAVNYLIVVDGAKCDTDESITTRAETIDVTYVTSLYLPSNTIHELQPLNKSVFKKSKCDELDDILERVTR